MHIGNSCHACSQAHVGLDLQAWALAQPNFQVLEQAWDYDVHVQCGDGFFLVAHNDADPADVLDLLNAIYAFAVDHAQTKNIDVEDTLTGGHPPRDSQNASGNAEHVCSALFVHGARELDDTDTWTMLDVHSVVVLSTLRFAFIGAHARHHWGDTLGGESIFVHTCVTSSSLSRLLTKVQALLATSPCLVCPSCLDCNIDAEAFDSIPEPVRGEGFTGRMPDTISRILLKSCTSSVRVARDGLPYSFPEFLAWYGASGVQRWCEASAAEAHARGCILTRVLDHGQWRRRGGHDVIESELFGPHWSLPASESNSRLETYSWQEQAGVFQPT